MAWFGATFRHAVANEGGLTATATVTVNLSGLTATPDTATVNEDAAATTIDVLANDALDPQIGGTLAITLRRMPAFGKLGRNIHYALGYSGHGIPTATLAGHVKLQQSLP